MTQTVKEDLKYIHERLSDGEKEILRGKSILVTGYAGSIGYLLLEYLRVYGDELGIEKVYGIDNFVFGKPRWLSCFQKEERFELRELDIIDCDLDFAADAQIIFHMASLASPVYYRLHPIETMDADVVGLRRLLDFYKEKEIHSLLFFSTSEIYGNPAVDQIPTKETYFGNVNTSGPRACYDESKRFGETICYNFHNVYNMPLTVVRPFNSFGPGLRTNDQRVVADFAQNVLANEDIVIYSNGKATRTFCYASDTITAILKAAVYGKYEIFNIGYDKEEMTIAELAEIYKEVGRKCTNYQGNIVYKTHEDKHYLTDNPQRRCPNIEKAQKLLNYMPEINTKTGVERYLKHLLEGEAQ